ncbi:hypothetical protein CEXT_440931 [Caerostris extrusa]|uniref:Uncharacterized protein n=1 Tax=Caerostris extrusa TaxID=172846 RepID=A0AAV4R075_CAEEX|nr:hypothetical protein CEXT_440931 [Caerostris extrusa]
MERNKTCDIFHLLNKRNRYTSAGGSVFVWGGINLGGAHITVCVATWNSQSSNIQKRHTDTIARPYAAAISETFILQVDENSSYCACHVNHLLKKNKSNGMTSMQSLTLIPLSVLSRGVLLASNPLPKPYKDLELF